MPRSLSPISRIGGGPCQNGMSPACESFFIDPYRLIYSAGDSEVVILGVLHQRRDFDRWGRTGSASDAP